MFLFKCIFSYTGNVGTNYHLISYQSLMNLIFLSTGCVCTFECTFISMLVDFLDKSINFLTWFLFELVELVMTEYLVLSWLVSIMKLFYHIIKISRFYFGHILVVFSLKISF